MKLFTCTSVFVFICLSSCAGKVNSQKSAPDSGISNYLSFSQQSVLLENASIYVGDGSPVQENSSVLIQENKITAVGDVNSFKLPDQIRRINLTGHTVIPGLIGMHNHTHMPGNTLMSFTAPRLYLANGVTSIATAGSADALGELKLKQAIVDGEVPGPMIYASAPYITGEGGNAVMYMPKDEQQAREFVKTWADQGVSWIKLYRHTDPEIAAVVIDEAHRHGLKVSGHLCSITYAQAASMGIDSLEHGLNAATDFVKDKPAGKCVPSRSTKINLELDSPTVISLIDLLVEKNVTLTSTLAILESGFPHRPQADERTLRVLSPALLDQYRLRQQQLSRNTSTTSTPEYWSKITAFEKLFVERGGRLVAGPDNGRHVLAGFGDQRNFELLVETGFSIPQTIKIMSSNGAQVLGIEDHLGLVKAGYQADLVVLDGDLANDPAVIRNTEIVFKAGQAYNPTQLISDVQGLVGIR